MPGFMVSNHLLVIGIEDSGLLLWPCSDPLMSILKVLKFDFVLGLPSCMQCCLIHQIGKVSTREARGQGGKSWTVSFEVFLQNHSAQVLLQDLLSLNHGWQVDYYMPGESTWSQQCFVQSFSPVGAGKHDHITGAGHTVHLHQQLVQCLLSLTPISTHSSCSTVPLFANGISLIGHSLSQHGLATARGSKQDCPSCGFGSKFFVLFRILQAIHKLQQFYFWFFQPSNIREFGSLALLDHGVNEGEVCLGHA